MTDPLPVTFILVRPQMSENVGMSARAMLNCGVTRLRLVAPREDHLCDAGVAASAGADRVLQDAQVFPTLQEAVADMSAVYATTARRRELVKEVLAPRQAVPRVLDKPGQTAVLFGPERSGLTNDDVALCDAIIEAPLNPGFTSLNLSQAVLLVAWELWQATVTVQENLPEHDPAPRGQMDTLFAHLEQELDACGFLRVTEKRPRMVQNIRTMLLRGQFTEQEVRTFHGIISELRHGGRADRPGKTELKTPKTP